MVKSVVNIHLMTLHSSQQSHNWTNKQLRVLAKRVALSLGSMNQKSREVVTEAFEKVDFYDNDLV